MAWTLRWNPVRAIKDHRRQGELPAPTLGAELEPASGGMPSMLVRGG